MSPDHHPRTNRLPAPDYHRAARPEPGSRCRRWTAGALKITDRDADPGRGDRSPLTGTSLIRRSPGVLVAAFGDGAAVYDLVTETTYLVGTLAAGLLADDSPVSLAAIADEAAMSTGQRPDAVLDLIVGAADELERLGLLNRLSTPPSPAALKGSRRRPTGATTGRVHAVLDHGIVFRSNDAALLEEVDAFLGTATDSRHPTFTFDLEANPSGGITLWTADEWRFPTREAFFAQLPDAVNEYAARSHSVVVLHSGGVRTPDGRVVLVPGPIDAGKSTLTAALVQAGCDYLGDESIGIREGSLTAVAYPKPLTIDVPGRSFLGLEDRSGSHVQPELLRADAKRHVGDAGPVAELVLPRFRAGRDPEAARLTPPDALRALLSNTLNLGRSGEAGLRTLCELAERVPATRITYGDSIGLARALIRDGTSPLIERTRRQRVVIDRIPLKRDVTVALLPIDAGDVAALLVRPPRPSLALDRMGIEIWRGLAAETSISQLVTEVAAPTADKELTRDLVRGYVDAMSRHGLLDRAAASVGSDGHLPLIVEELERWAGSTRWLHNARPATPARQEPVEVYRWPPSAVTTILGHLRITTDCPAVARALQLVTWPSTADSADERSALTIEVRQVPGDRSGAFLRIAEGEPTWIPAGDEVATIAVLLANRVPGRTDGSVPIAEIWTLEDADRVALHVGDPTGATDSAGSVGQPRWRRRLGLRVERGEVVLVPDRAAALDWLAGGADPGDVERVWSRRQLAAIGAAGSRCTADGWAEAVDALLIHGRDLEQVHHLVADGQPRLVLDDHAGSTPARRIASLMGWGPYEPAVDPGARSTAGGRSSRRGRPPADDLMIWAEALGRAEVGDQSTKLDDRGISLARPLLSVALTRDRQRLSVERLTEAIARLGLAFSSAEHAAAAAAGIGRLYVSEERGTAGSWRRKLYVHRPAATTWRSLAPTWPAELTETADTPTWIGWKWDSGSAGAVVRSVDLGHLAGAGTIEAGIAPILDAMGAGWAELVCHVMARAGIHPHDAPEDADAITLDEDGRRSADLGLAGRWPSQARGDAEGELRWMAALGGHAGSDAEALVAWASGGRLANLIFGTDRYGRTFVNVYVRGLPTFGCGA